jgi:hypothetical protein
VKPLFFWLHPHPKPLWEHVFRTSLQEPFCFILFGKKKKDSKRLLKLVEKPCQTALLLSRRLRVSRNTAISGGKPLTEGKVYGHVCSYHFGNVDVHQQPHSRNPSQVHRARAHVRPCRSRCSITLALLKYLRTFAKEEMTSD